MPGKARLGLLKQYEHEFLPNIARPARRHRYNVGYRDPGSWGHDVKPGAMDPSGNLTESSISCAEGGGNRLPQRKLVLNGLRASYLHNGVSLLVGFVATPLYIGSMGIEMFGLWMTLCSIINYFNLSTNGMTMTGSVFLAEAYAKKDDDRIARVLTTSLVLWLGVALAATIFFLALIVTGLISPGVFGESNAVNAVAIPALAVLVIGFLASQPMNVFRLAVRSFQRVDIEQTCTAIFRVVLLAAGLFVLALGGGVISLAWISVLCQIGLGVLFVSAAYKIAPQLRIRPSSFDVSMARSFVVPSLYFVLIGLGGSLIWGADNLVISSQLGASSVTLFAVPMQLLTVGCGLVAAAISALMPTVTALHAMNEKLKLRLVLLRVVKFGFALTSLLGLGCLFFGQEFLRSWVGPPQVASGLVLSVLLAIFMIRTFAMFFEMVIVGTLQHKGYAYVVFGEGVLNLALSLILVRQFGILGVAIGTLLAHIACTAWYLPAKAMRLTGCQFKDVFFQAIFPILPAAAIAAGSAWIYLRIMIEPGWIRIIAGSTVTGLAFVAGLWFLGLSREEREMLRSIRNEDHVPGKTYV